MIERYADKRNTENWSLPTKYRRWQEVELAVIKAREQLGRITAGIHSAIKELFLKHPINPQTIANKEKELSHDLAAFVAERKDTLPKELEVHIHSEGMTSYDVEEPAFAAALRCACDFVLLDVDVLAGTLKTAALRYRYLPKLERTHGQWAELQSFGRCILAWYQDLEAATTTLERSMENLQFSKLSGMIGSNSSMDPELEREALAILGFKPWPGSTQIMSRVMYSPIADALANIASVIEKVSFDIWLGSRSGRPLWHEPFKKTQIGSSAGPHKRNPISDEQNRGMGNMARSDAACIKNMIVTAEGRDISQSCVERVKWPDLFDEVLRAIKNLNGVLSGLVVYPENMLYEIVDSRGTYAASTTKEVLAKLGLPFGLSSKEAYRIVQLASHNVFEPNDAARWLREHIPTSLVQSNEAVAVAEKAMHPSFDKPVDIQHVVIAGQLRVSPTLDFNEVTVTRWNGILKQIFKEEANVDQLLQVFLPSYIMGNEYNQFREVFGV